MNAAPEKKCRSCSAQKPVDAFNKAPTRFGGDGRTSDCKECRAKRRAAKAAGGGHAEPEADSEPSGPRITAAPTIGFQASLQGDDVVIEQTTDQGRATVWLARGEARLLAEFVASLDRVTPKEELACPLP